jgi:DegV family protein with EDD domain
MAIHILTDSSHYLEPKITQALDLHVLPLSLNLDGASYREREDITTSELFDILKKPNVGWPVTSAITTGMMQAAFDELTSEPQDEVVGIFMSAGTSATVDVARSVAQSHPAQARIHVVDSLVLCAPLALTLITASKLVREGPSAPQIASVARRMGEEMRVFFTVDTLEYLHRGGRMRGSQALLGSMLRIKPVLYLKDGRIELWKKGRGKRHALNLMMEDAIRSIPPGEAVLAIVGDAHAPEVKASMTQTLEERLNVIQMVQAEISPVVATHVGPGCVVFTLVPAVAASPSV